MAAAEKAVDEIETLLKDVEVGEIYEGEVKRIKEDFGAFIEILPGKDGLLRIGRMENYHVDRIEDVMNIGDKVKVKVTEIDGQGRINLSRKELLDKE
jgi:polyribonucleotide nucleotidyltransferase